MGDKLGRLKAALKLAEKGFFVFPVAEKTKVPIKGMEFKSESTRDPEKIKSWWSDKNYNIGIYTGRFGEGKALVGVDIDNKPNKKGFDTVLKLELEGKDFPETFTQKTPTGGKHLIYVNDFPVKQGESILGHGVDIRSHGGYLVAASSELENGTYEYAGGELESVPEWIVQVCQTPQDKTSREKIEVDRKNATERAIYYLQNEAPLAAQGDGGDHTTFAVAARIKDFGLDRIDCQEVLDTYWNPRCSPPWSSGELARKIENAYRYGNNPQGADSPEAHFGKASNPADPKAKESHPFEVLNREFSFLTKNSEILWETVDFKGNPDLMYLTLSQFHNHLLSKVMIDGNGKAHQISQGWLRSPTRRSYVNTCFAPGRTPPSQFYNLWRGFQVNEFGPDEVVPKIAQDSLNNLLAHVKENICENSDELFTWYMGYFAHLIQKPFEKPLTCIVMKGKKGTGKNAVIRCVNRLLGSHALVVANKRYLTGNFNFHLEKLLLFTLDEAFWSGDKSSEGVLKDLVTGDTHFIERKGYEPYAVDNLTRLVVIGNDDWVVPASEDERRYAVFSVGDGRRKDSKFFQSITDGMKAGGDRLLLTYLKNFDLSKIDVNVAPTTEGLLEQKQASLDPIQQWWFNCLEHGALVDVGIEDKWPEEVECEVIREGALRNLKERNVRSWFPTPIAFGKALDRMCPSSRRFRKPAALGRAWAYRLPTVETARQEFETFIGHKIKWPDLSEG